MSMRAASTSLACAQSAAPRPNSTLNFRVARELLKHKGTYNDSIRPFLQGLNSHTHGVLRYLPPHLMRMCQDQRTKRFLPLEQVMRKPVAAEDITSDVSNLSSSSAFIRPMSSVTAERGGVSAGASGASGAAAIDAAEQLATPDPAVTLGMEALNTINLLQDRLAMTEHKSLSHVDYEFEVGDLVVHKDLRQLGVVAARLPVCLESEKWVVENIGSMQDRRMAHPWYLILVAHHAGLPLDFVRYGSQLTHTKIPTDSGKPIGFHRLLPLYFQGYDHEKGCYIPRGRLPPPKVEAPPVAEAASSLASAPLEELPGELLVEGPDASVDCEAPVASTTEVKDAEVVSEHQSPTPATSSSPPTINF